MKYWDWFEASKQAKQPTKQNSHFKKLTVKGLNYQNVHQLGPKKNDHCIMCTHTCDLGFRIYTCIRWKGLEN